MPDYPAVFARFLERKAEIVEKYGSPAARPQWRANTVWAGLLIAVGNEYVKRAIPSPSGKSGRPWKPSAPSRSCRKPSGNYAPRAWACNKQIVADLIGSGRFGTLTALYRLKNHM